MRIRKYFDYYYQVVKVEGGFGWVMYNQYQKEGREILEKSDKDSGEPFETESEADTCAIENIQYHYV